MLALAMLAVAAATAPLAPWMDSSMPVDARVETLLAQMTNEEKQAQTIHLCATSIDVAMEQYGTTSLGAFPGRGNGSVASVKEQSTHQAYFINTSRLHIPVTWHFETLHSGGGGADLPDALPAGCDLGHHPRA